jgi:hypothetical protein
VSSNPVHGKVYSIQLYMIKCLSDLDRLVCVNILIKIVFGNVSPPQWYDGRMVASNVVDHGFVPFYFWLVYGV